MSIRRKDGPQDYIASLDAFKIIATADHRGPYWTVKPLTPWANQMLDNRNDLIGNNYGWREGAAACFVLRATAYSFVDELERDAAKWSTT